MFERVASFMVPSQLILSPLRDGLCSFQVRGESTPSHRGRLRSMVGLSPAAFTWGDEGIPAGEGFSIFGGKSGGHQTIRFDCCWRWSYDTCSNLISLGTSFGVGRWSSCAERWCPCWPVATSYLMASPNQAGEPTRSEIPLSRILAQCSK